MPADHGAGVREFISRFAKLAAVPVTALDDVEVLLPSDEAAAEWNEFVFAFCRQAGAEPRRVSGSTHGSMSAARVARERGCVVPTMAWAEPLPGLTFRRVVDPQPNFAWSLMTAEDAPERGPVATLKGCAERVARERGWSQETQRREHAQPMDDEVTHPRRRP